MEVSFEDQDLRLTVRYALDLVAPLARDLDRRLDGLGAGVHGQHLRVAGQVMDRLVERTELVREKGTRRQRHTLGLFFEGLAQARMGVALVDCRVSRQEIEVLVAVGVPDPDALPALDHDVQRVVVIGAVFLLEMDEVGGVGSCGGHSSTSWSSSEPSRPLGLEGRDGVEDMARLPEPPG